MGPGLQGRLLAGDRAATVAPDARAPWMTPFDLARLDAESRKTIAESLAQAAAGETGDVALAATVLAGLDDADDRLAVQARLDLLAGHADAAVVKLRELLLKSDRDPRVVRLLAQALVQAGQATAALDELDAQVAHATNQPDP